MTKVFIVQGLGFGDSEEAFENIAAFSTRPLAQTWLNERAAEDLRDDLDTDYQIVEVDLLG